ncbi:hypothetical protein QBC44DRAFT_310244 [Cladorrhinum sp. PSN332]|nr:hypothetical protein QBC44DRAFT_310244 [Cladorrhinum sp. PSN332]
MNQHRKLAKGFLDFSQQRGSDDGGGVTGVVAREPDTGFGARGSAERDERRWIDVLQFFSSDGKPRMVWRHPGEEARATEKESVAEPFDTRNGMMGDSSGHAAQGRKELMLRCGIALTHQFARPGDCNNSSAFLSPVVSVGQIVLTVIGSRWKLGSAGLISAIQIPELIKYTTLKNVADFCSSEPGKLARAFSHGHALRSVVDVGVDVDVVIDEVLLVQPASHHLGSLFVFLPTRSIHSVQSAPHPWGLPSHLETSLGPVGPGSPIGWTRAWELAKDCAATANLQCFAHAGFLPAPKG